MVTESVECSSKKKKVLFWPNKIIAEYAAYMFANVLVFPCILCNTFNFQKDMNKVFVNQV